MDSGKRCFTYCGDDFCTCEARNGTPFAPELWGQRASTMTRADLTPLIERLEGAEEGSRELDAQLHCLGYGLEFVCFTKGSQVYGDICDPSDHGYGWKSHCSPGMLYARYPEHLRGNGNIVQGCKPKPYTNSLDDAVALVKRVLPGWDIDITIEPNVSLVRLLETKDAGPCTDTIIKKSASLALCIALLRALAEGEART